MGPFFLKTLLILNTRILLQRYLSEWEPEEGGVVVTVFKGVFGAVEDVEVGIELVGVLFNEVWMFVKVPGMAGGVEEALLWVDVSQLVAAYHARKVCEEGVAVGTVLSLNRVVLGLGGCLC